MTPILDSEDVFMWPEGTWCYRYQFADMGWMSDDYEILLFGSEKWAAWDVLTDTAAY